MASHGCLVDLRENNGKHVRRFKDEKHESRKYEETNAWRTLKKKVQFGLPQTSVLHPSTERGWYKMLLIVARSSHTLESPRTSSHVGTGRHICGVTTGTTKRYWRLCLNSPARPRVTARGMQRTCTWR